MTCTNALNPREEAADAIRPPAEAAKGAAGDAKGKTRTELWEAYTAARFPGPAARLAARVPAMALTNHFRFNQLNSAWTLHDPLAQVLLIVMSDWPDVTTWVPARVSYRDGVS